MAHGASLLTTSNILVENLASVLFCSLFERVRKCRPWTRPSPAVI